MWSPERLPRRAALGLCLALAACGFAPVYGPGGAGGALQGQVTTSAPTDRAGYLLNQRLEERLGHATAGRYLLETRITTRRDDLGTGTDGRTNRYNLLGQVAYTLREGAGGPALATGSVDDFTGYSATGSTVATQAAARDAERRLMVILADKLVDRLLLTLPGPAQ